MDVKTIAVAILGGAFDHNELGDNDIACVPGALEELQQKHVTGSDDVQLDLIERSHFDRVTAERDALQLRLNAVEEENDRLRAIFGKYGNTLRPFVELMRKELDANSHKGDREGWLGMSRRDALLELHYHVAKLHYSVAQIENEKSVEFSADVSNCCMMLLDVCGLLEVKNV